MKQRIHALDLEPPLARVLAYFSADGEAADRLFLVRRFGKAEIRALLEGGHLFETICGGLFLTPLTVRELGELPPWKASEEKQLRQMWDTALLIKDIARCLGRTGGDVLQHAWAMELGGRIAQTHPDFESFVPAWRFKRLRIALAEAERRGLVAGDDGADILEHRALRRRFECGRLHARYLPDKHGARWSANEVRTLRRLRDDGKTIGAIARLMMRSPAAVTTKIYENGLSIDRTWSLFEDEILVDSFRRKYLTKTLMKLLPGRTKASIGARARQLGVSGQRAARQWSAAERDSLRKLILAGGSIRAWAKEHGRSTSACQYQRVLMGIIHPNSTLNRIYSEADNACIRAGYAAGEPPSAIAAALGRPIKSIYCQAFHLGLTGDSAGYRRRVTPEEIEMLRTMAAAGTSSAEIATAIGRTLQATYRLANKNGISLKRQKGRGVGRGYQVRKTTSTGSQRDSGNLELHVS